MGKKAKEHRKRVAKRNQRIADEKKRFEKMAMKFLNTIIEKENSEGKFDNPVQPLPVFDGSGPSLGLPFSPTFELTNKMSAPSTDVEYSVEKVEVDQSTELTQSELTQPQTEES